MLDDSNIDEVIAVLTARLRGLGKLPKEVLEEIGEIGLSSIAKNFQDQGRFGNANEFGGGAEKWPANKRGGHVLLDKGQLASSIDYEIQGQNVLFGTNRPGAAILQFGGRIEAKNATFLRFQINGQWVSKKSVEIPARPYIVLQDADMIAIVEALGDYYAELLS